MVVRATARTPKPNVRIEAIRCGLSGLARRRKIETINVRKAKAVAGNPYQNDFGKLFKQVLPTGWRTKAMVVAVEIVLSSFRAVPLDELINIDWID